MPRGISVLSPHLFLSSQYRGPRILNDANASADAEAKAKADADATAKADADKKALADKSKGDDSETRISKLVEERNEARKKLKEKEDAEKAADDEKLKKKGEFETLLKTRDTELETERKAKTEYEGKLAKYETDAKKRLDESLKSITDEEKQKSARAMLEGRPLEDQIALLPEVLKLAGQAQAAGFGGSTPQGTKEQIKSDNQTKQTRFDALLLKAVKEKLTPQEQQEKDKLARELSTALKS